MERAELEALCGRVGITTWYGDRAVPDASLVAILRALGHDPETGDAPGLPGLHDDPARAGTCHMPEGLAERPAWGLVCQLYELRSSRNWGIGDFADLARLARIAAEAGADFIGVNPLHALFLAAPERHSPFTPSNRAFLNPLYIAMDDLPGAAVDDPATLTNLRAAELVDYPAVAAAKRRALAEVFAATPFNADHPKGDFDTFRAEGGTTLERHALFEALSQHMTETGHGAGWKDWPGAYHGPDTPEVAAFARAHPEQVSFHIWLQWLAARQLAGAQKAALAAGMRIGLYLDFAVGEAPDGSATWGAPDLFLRGLSVGAPPDVFAQDGQYWDLAALSPTALAEAWFAPLRRLIAAQMRHAGALRIDHAMGLKQLFLVPEGAPALAGAHVAYPFADMLATVASESRAQETVVIGEDLGFVPDGFRETMRRADMLAYRILYFEQDWGLFRRASTYPEMALACISTHDLPTLAGWWRCEDIGLRHRFGLIDAANAEAQHARRAEERSALVAALIDGGQLPADCPDGSAETLTARVLTASYRFLGATPCRLVAVRLADLVGPEGATNVPGTTREHPNWQRRSPVTLDRISADPAFRDVSAALRALRPR